MRNSLQLTKVDEHNLRSILGPDVLAHASNGIAPPINGVLVALRFNFKEALLLLSEGLVEVLRVLHEVLVVKGIKEHVAVFIF